MNTEAIQAFMQRFARGALLAPVDAAGLSNLPGIRTLAAAFVSATADVYERDMERCFRDVMQAYGQGTAPVSKPFPFTSGGTAIIPVHGILLNRYNYATSYATGYNAIRSMINAALADADVKNIVLDVNSFGGQAAGAFEIAADIREARKKKPVTAIVDSYAFSAAYAVASAADRIVMAPSAEAGSIGVVATHVSFEKALKEFGIEVTFIYAGKHKVDGNPYEALSEDAKKSIQVGVDRFYNAFVASVGEGRGKRFSESDARKTEARCYDAEDCVKMGLADAIQAPEAALAAVESNEGGDAASITSAEKEPATMSENNQAAAEAAAAARVAERERVSGILSCEEAKGRERLANHLATETDLSVEQAKAILAAAPKEQAAGSGERNLLADAMNKIEQPNVGADGGSADDKAAEKTPAQIGAEMWEFYSARTGRSGSASKPN